MGFELGQNEGVEVGILLDSRVGFELGENEGVNVGFGTGFTVGLRVGDLVGALVGCLVGTLVGCGVGCGVGSGVGCGVGDLVGILVGNLVGWRVGMGVLGDTSGPVDGPSEGSNEGFTEGITEGDEEKSEGIEKFAVDRDGGKYGTSSILTTRGIVSANSSSIAFVFSSERKYDAEIFDDCISGSILWGQRQTSKASWSFLLVIEEGRRCELLAPRCLLRMASSNNENPPDGVKGQFLHRPVTWKTNCCRRLVVVVVVLTSNRRFVSLVYLCCNVRRPASICSDAIKATLDMTRKNSSQVSNERLL